MGHDRRRAPRLTAGWQSRYTLDERPDDGWYNCRVLDISLGGAALELFGPAPLEGAGIRIELHTTGLPAGMQLDATARHMDTGAGTGTGMRVGFEWHELTFSQATLLNTLLKLTYLRAS